MIDQKVCKEVHPISVFIHSEAENRGLSSDKRDAIRKTWVEELKGMDVSVYFVIGSSTHSEVNEELSNESDEYQDLIQFEFNDGYYNPTLKTIAILRWVEKKCTEVKHILLVKDNALVNPRFLVEHLSDLKPGFGGVGSVQKFWALAESYGQQGSQK